MIPKPKTIKSKMPNNRSRGNKKTKVRKNTKRTAEEVQEDISIIYPPKVLKLTNDVATFVFMGLTGTSVLPIPPRILEISLFAFRREDIQLMQKQGIPRVGNRLTLSFHPQRSIPIWTMQHTGMLNSTVKDECTFSENDFNVMNGFLDRLPKPVCLVSYQAELYDFYVLRRELSRIKKQFHPELLCVSLRKLVSNLCNSLKSCDINHVHEKLCNGSSVGEDTAERTVNTAIDIFEKIPGGIGWIDINHHLFNEKE